ncbi:hypothetical protein LSH36_184g03020 [Paralvinella palmiformis]|uniref:Uncharacterized protein n=1 Tax=Paralvinella palmiformis TaxID=53620 RepID=A0AAD9JRU0_9ANNE|nr:hypothetical protein LSH36_184g03020 [Paralvinella palmiformis]
MSKRKDSKDYGEMTIPLLKQELGLRKAKLLESYDRNDNFGHQLVQAEQFNMNVPEQSGYKDINSETQIPTVTEEQVKIYMDLYGQDLKENSKVMYKAKFLRSIRLASQKENVYICGRVSAEMYKKCIYNVDKQESIEIKTRGQRTNKFWREELWKRFSGRAGIAVVHRRITSAFKSRLSYA